MELFVALVFVCFGLLGFAAASLLFSNRRPVKQRLARLSNGSKAPIEMPASEGSGLLDTQKGGLLARLLAPFAGRAAEAGDSPNLALGRVQQRLIEAGYRRPSAVTVYMGGRVLLSVLVPLVVLILSPAWELSRVQLVLMVCGAAGLGLVAPSFYVDRKRSARQLEILLGLPDALDLMVVCVEAGLGVNSSLSRVAKEFHRSSPTLSSEFELVNLETRAGKSSTEALRGLAERTGVSQVASLVAMLVQTERFGTSVADTLRVFADSLRNQRWLRAEEQAGKAPLKMLFPTLIIFMATLLVVLGPGMIQMFAFFGDNTPQ